MLVLKRISGSCRLSPGAATPRRPTIHQRPPCRRLSRQAAGVGGACDSVACCGVDKVVSYAADGEVPKRSYRHRLEIGWGPYRPTRVRIPPSPPAIPVLYSRYKSVRSFSNRVGEMVNHRVAAPSSTGGMHATYSVTRRGLGPSGRGVADIHHLRKLQLVRLSQTLPDPLLPTSFRRAFFLSRMIYHFTHTIGERPS